MGSAQGETVMSTRSKAEYRQMAAENFADVRATLDALPDERWDEAVLCDGWRVRDLVGHLVAGTTIPVPRVVGRVAAGGFIVDKAVMEVSIEVGERPIADLRASFNEESAREKPRGVAGLMAPKAVLCDWVTHHLDIIVPLDLDVDIPEERLVEVLEVLPTINNFKTKKRAKGLRLVASDVDRTGGSGPEVRGEARALILALGGRPALADSLTGDGAEVLRGRVAA